jgi:hypothetical protein
MTSIAAGFLCGSVLLTIVLGGLGSIMLFITYKLEVEAKAARHWPSVMGRIISSGIKSKTIHTTKGASTSYWPEIRYSYTVADSPFESDSINVGGTFGYSKKSAEARVAKYRPNTVVQVYYNPENPATAILEQDAPGIRYFRMLAYVMLGCWIIGILFMAGAAASVN